VQEFQSTSWAQFRTAVIASFQTVPLERRQNWWFRGQSNATYRLEPTIDRGRTFPSDSAREASIARLLREFRSEAMLISSGLTLPPDEGFELLGRHHGLPSPYLDFTRTPWIAIYFAFATAKADSGEYVAIYAFDKKKVPTSSLIATGASPPPLELFEDPDDVRFNRRALQQRGVFLRVSTRSQTPEALLGPALYRWLIPTSERQAVLTELDLMLLNSTMLMYDLDGAARTVEQRLM
jgi:hypothetical protein